jgi:hypothetical protein
MIPTQTSKHVNGGEIRQDGDILYGFEIQSQEPITRVAVTLGNRVLWLWVNNHFKDKFSVSLDESLDGLTIPLISFLFFRFHLSAYGNRGILKDVEITMYYSFLDTKERMAIASLPHVYSKNNTLGAAFTDSVFEIFAKKMQSVDQNITRYT